MRCEDTEQKGNHSNFLIPTVVGGRCPVTFEICAQSDPPFEKRRLWQISAYNVWTVRDSEQNSIMRNTKSTTGFPTSYRRSAYVTPESPNAWFKKRFFCFFLFLTKIRLHSNKACHKVSLCENFQRQNCSITIPLFNGP